MGALKVLLNRIQFFRFWIFLDLWNENNKKMPQFSNPWKGEQCKENGSCKAIMPLDHQSDIHFLYYIDHGYCTIILVLAFFGVFRGLLDFCLTNQMVGENLKIIAQ